MQALDIFWWYYIKREGKLSNFPQCMHYSYTQILQYITRTKWKGSILRNIAWRDNWSTQYNCLKNFWKVALSEKSNNFTIIHKFAKKIKCWGLWDVTGKLVNEATMDNTLPYKRRASDFTIITFLFFTTRCMIRTVYL